MDREGTARLPVRVAGSTAAAAPVVGPPAAFLAQALGQGGARRGLRGGPPVLASARAAYLGAEWSGPQDRRPAPGLLRRDRV